MDKKTFDELAAKTKMQETALNLAEDILCNGMSTSEAAKKWNVSRQLAIQSKRRILREMQLVENYPDDWIVITVALPKVWAQLVRYIQQKEHEKAGLIKKGVPTVPEFELSNITELSNLVDEILKAWRKTY